MSTGASGRLSPTVTRPQSLSFVDEHVEKLVTKTTSLFEAVQQKELEKVRLLIEQKADVNANGLNGRTPLIIAAEAGSLEIVELLFKHGASALHSDDDGWTPFLAAVRKGHIRMIQSLIQHRVSVHTCLLADRRNALFIAVEEDRVDIVALLLKHKVCKTWLNISNQTPIDIARQKGNKEILKLLGAEEV